MLNIIIKLYKYLFTNKIPSKVDSKEIHKNDTDRLGFKKIEPPNDAPSEGSVKTDFNPDSEFIKITKNSREIRQSLVSAIRRNNFLNEMKRIDILINNLSKKETEKTRDELIATEKKLEELKKLKNKLIHEKDRYLQQGSK